MSSSPPHAPPCLLAFLASVQLHVVHPRAQSGTGKTATFSISALARIDNTVRDTQALILSPTRELAMQIQKVVLALGDYLSVQVRRITHATGDPRFENAFLHEREGGRWRRKEGKKNIIERPARTCTHALVGTLRFAHAGAKTVLLAPSINERPPHEDVRLFVGSHSTFVLTFPPPPLFRLLCSPFSFPLFGTDTVNSATHALAARALARIHGSLTTDSTLCRAHRGESLT